MINYLKFFICAAIFFLFASGLFHFNSGDLISNLTEVITIKKALAATPVATIGNATEGRRTGNCSYTSIIKEYTCASYNEDRSLYDGLNKGSTFGDIGHAWPIFDGLNSNNADEKTYQSCGQALRTGGKVDKWTCENSGGYKWVNKGEVSTPVTLDGTINPKGDQVGYVFGYFLYNDSSSTWTPWQDWSFTGSSPVYVSANVALTPGTKYFYKLWVWDYTTSSGYSSGVSEFTTSGSRPTNSTATSNSPTNITENSVTINGTVNPDGDYISYGFNGNLPSMPPWVIYGKGTSDISASYNISGLTPATTYSYELVVYDYYTGKNIQGGVQSFTTLGWSGSSPTAEAKKPTYISSTASNLIGIVNAKGNTGLTYKFCLNGTWWCSRGKSFSGNYDRNLLDYTTAYSLSLSPDTTYTKTVVVMKNGTTALTSNSISFTTAPASPSSSSSSSSLGTAKSVQVNKSGNGRGYVEISDGTSEKIKCTSNKYINSFCKASYPKNSNVTITATAASGSTFSGFGGCPLAIGNSCTIDDLITDKEITVYFN